MKHLSKLALLAAAFFAGLSASAQNLTLKLSDALYDEETYTFYAYNDGDKSIAEGTYVQINMSTYHTQVMNIYMNGEVVYTKPSGAVYKSNVYHFTAGKNCKILGGNSNVFNWNSNPNIRITMDASVAVTANEGASGEYWATYYNSAQGYTADANTTVYQAAVNGTKTGVVLTEVTGREIPAGQGVVLKSSAATIALTPVLTTQTLTGNELLGTDVDLSYPGGNVYCLSKSGDAVGFYTYTSTDGSLGNGTIPAHKAYLVVASAARSFLGFGGDDNTTGISLPEAVVIENDGPIYDLSGRRIEGQPQKGIYVKNGKKVVIK